MSNRTWASHAFCAVKCHSCLKAPVAPAGLWSEGSWQRDSGAPPSVSSLLPAGAAPERADCSSPGREPLCFGALAWGVAPVGLVGYLLWNNGKGKATLCVLTVIYFFFLPMELWWFLEVHGLYKINFVVWDFWKYRMDWLDDRKIVLSERSIFFWREESLPS